MGVEDYINVGMLVAAQQSAKTCCSNMVLKAGKILVLPELRSRTLGDRIQTNEC